LQDAPHAPQGAIRLYDDAEIAPVNGAAPRIIRDGDDTARWRVCEFARGERGESIWKVLITSVRSATSELLFSLMLRRHPHKLSGLRSYDDTIRVMQWATAVLKNTKINHHDHVRVIALNIMRDLRSL